MPRTFAVALFPAFLSFLLPGTLGSLNVETSTSQENCHKLVLFEELKKIDGHFLRELIIILPYLSKMNWMTSQSLF